MIPYRTRVGPQLSNRNTEGETFWAAYSDLMAGVLMVFALTTAMTMLSIGKRFVEPTEKVRTWQEVIKDLTYNEKLKALGVEVNKDTGALIIESDQLQFPFNSSVLGKGGKTLLQEVIPTYLDVVLKKPQVQEFIEEIEISGHTDRVDLNYANPRISRDRAGAVLDFLLHEPLLASYQDFFRRKAVTAGYADTRFPSGKCKQDECSAARRVEIVVRLKNEDVLSEFMSIMEKMYPGL